MNKGARVLLVFSIGLILFGVVGIAAYINTQGLIERNNRVVHAHEVVENLGGVLSALKDAETGQRGFILTGQDRYLEPYNQGIGEIQDRLAKLTDLTVDNPEQQAAVVRLKSLVSMKLAELQQTIDLFRNSGTEAATKVILAGRGKEIMDETRGLVSQMGQREQQLLQKRDQQSQSAARRIIFAIAGGIPLSLVMLAVAAIIFMRSGFPDDVSVQGGAGSRRSATIARYALAALAVGFATLLRRWLLTFGPMPLFITFYPAVLLAATVAGGGPGVLATTLSAFVADYLFIPPIGQFSIQSTNDVLALALFVGTNLVLCVVAERLRRSRWAEAYGLAKHQEAEELAARNEELSQQSEELAQQNEELQSQSEEIQTLNTELSGKEGTLQKLLNATRLVSSEEAVLKDICSAAIELLGPVAVAVVVWEKREDLLVLRAQTGIKEEPKSLPLEGAFAGIVIQEGRTASLNDASLRPDLKLLHPAGEERYHAALSAPLHVAEKIFGAVTIYSRQKQDWTAEQFRLVEWVAAQCGHILETLRLQESQSRLAAIVASSDDAILSKDLDGMIQTWNAGAERLFGYRAEEVIGRPVTLLMPADRFTEEEEILRQLQAGKLVDHRETVRIAKDGRRIDVMVTACPVKDRAGQIVGASKIVRDITERREYEETIRKTIGELERSNKELEQFAYISSHDMQEPLRQVRGFVQLLRDKYKDRFDEKAGQYFQFIYDGAERMSNLVSDLLEYSRVGSRVRKREPVSGLQALDFALANLDASIQEAGATITHDELPTATCDRTQLTQLFQNLIGNAIKFRRADVPPVIHIGVNGENGHWLFWVRDNGIGIASEYSQRIFQIFQRLHTRERYPGTGIGLAICKKIVERHGGKIWVESKPGEGATFYFTLAEERD
jgi:PAS domain S-box-containing protein